MRSDPEQLKAMKAWLSSAGKQADKPVAQIRRDMNAMADQLPPLPRMTAEAVSVGPLEGEWVSGGQLDPALLSSAILYLHGGSFVAGSCGTHRDLAARISLAAGVRVLTVNYRLAPEYPYPAANEDSLLAYRWLLAEGYPPGQLVIGGDSVGASLALMTLLTLRDSGELLPAGACLLSPHADLVHLDGESYVSRAGLDPLGSRETNERLLRDYLGSEAEAGAAPVLLSPLRMNLEGLPSLLIQAGAAEVLLSDAERLAQQARLAGVEVTLEVWEDMWSAFQLLAAILPEARQAIANIGRFVRSIIGK